MIYVLSNLMVIKVNLPCDYETQYKSCDDNWDLELDGFYLRHMVSDLTKGT